MCQLVGLNSVHCDGSGHHALELTVLIVSFVLLIITTFQNLFSSPPLSPSLPLLAVPCGTNQRLAACLDARYNAPGLDEGGRCLCGLIIRTQWPCCHQPCHLLLKRHDCVSGLSLSFSLSPTPLHPVLNRSNFPRAMKSRNGSRKTPRLRHYLSGSRTQCVFLRAEQY